MKKIGLIGASGFIGFAILKEALGRGHKVKALVRNACRLPVRHPNMSVSICDVMDTDTLTRNVAGVDTIISAYHPGWNHPDISGEILRGYSSIIYAAIRSGVPRLLVVGEPATLFINSCMRLMDTGKIPKEKALCAKSLTKIYSEYLEPEKNIDWVYFCPSQEVSTGDRTGKFREAKNQLIKNEKGESRISLEDYAYAMMDEVEQLNHHYEPFTIGY